MTDNSALSNRTSRIRSIAAYASLLISIVVLFLKIWAFHKTGSQAIYSDAVESIVNIITAIVAIGVIVYASKPVDKDHPYGHGKIEYVSAAFEGGLISFAAILVIFDAVKAQFHHEQLSQLSAGLWLLVACALINWGTGYFLKFLGKKHASPALESSGVHLLTDFGTTVGALVGVVAPDPHYPWPGNPGAVRAVHRVVDGEPSVSPRLPVDCDVGDDAVLHTRDEHHSVFAQERLGGLGDRLDAPV